MYGDGTIWYDKARKKYCYDYCDNDGKRHRKRFATEKKPKNLRKKYGQNVIKEILHPLQLPLESG